MKVVFFLLLFVNLLFFLWEKNQGFSQSGPVPTLPDGVEKLTLAPQSSSSPAAANPKPQAAPSESQPQPAPANPVLSAPANNPAPDQTCQRVGPFNTQNQAVSFHRKLKAQNLEVTAVKIPTSTETGYTLVYPPAADFETAQANRKMLESKGFKGAWVITEGANQFGVTLAYFNSKQKSEAAAARYQATGLNIQVVPKLSLGEKWWLELKGPTDSANLAPALLASQLKTEGCQ